MKVLGINRNRSNASRKVFHQFLITYLIVFLVPLLIFSVYYIRMAVRLAEDELHTMKMELEHSASQIETMYEEFENMGNVLTVNKQVNLFKHREEEVWHSPNSFRLIELRDSLPQIQLMNQNVYNYFIFFDKSKLVVNDKDIYTWEDYYHLYMRPSDSASYEEWCENFEKNRMPYGVLPEQKYLYRNTQELDLLGYSRPLMTEDGMNNSGLLILFEKQALANRMPHLDEDEIQYLADSEGNLIFFDASERYLDKKAELQEILLQKMADPSKENGKYKIGGKTLISTQYRSDNSEFLYGILIEQTSIWKKLMYTIGIIILSGVLSIVAGLILSVVMTRRSAAPINEIMGEISRVIEKNETHRSVFTTLKSDFSYLVKKNSDLAARIESQKPYFKLSYINRLLMDDIFSEEEARKMADYLEFANKDKVFVLVLFSLESNWQEIDPEFLASCILSLTEMVEKEIPDSLYAGMENNRVAVLLSLDPSKVDTFHRDMELCVERIREGMPSSISEHLFVYGSKVKSRLTDSYEAYQECSRMFQYGSDQSENSILWYDSQPEQTILFPTENMETRLSSYVFAGDSQGLHDELERFVTKWFLDTSMPSYMQQLVISELQMILIHILKNLDASQEEIAQFYEQLEKNMTAPIMRQISITINLYRDICSFVSEKKQLSGSDSLMANVASYIDVNYGDSALSLTQIAEMFSISESSLSSLFKNTQGIKFSSYVESIRISKAKELLETTTLSVSEISERVGYGSANSFCRAFRRVTGINTSEYRKK